MLHIHLDFSHLAHHPPHPPPSFHLVPSFTFSAVHPRAESEASVGVWTNTDNLCQVLMGRSEESTSPRANRSVTGRREGGWEWEKKNCKQLETLRILGERSRDGSADIRMSAISICCLWDLFRKGKKNKGNRGRVPGGENTLCHNYIQCSSTMDRFFINCWSPTRSGQFPEKEDALREFISEALVR